MIKGVNRKIVEINQTDSIYFEKAVFYLRPNVRELPCEISRSEAEKYVARVIPEYRRNSRKRRIMTVTAVCGISVAVAISLLIIFFI